MQQPNDVEIHINPGDTPQRQAECWALGLRSIGLSVELLAGSGGTLSAGTSPFVYRVVLPAGALTSRG